MLAGLPTLGEERRVGSYSYIDVYDTRKRQGATKMERGRTSDLTLRVEQVSLWF